MRSPFSIKRQIILRFEHENCFYWGAAGVASCKQDCKLLWWINRGDVSEQHQQFALLPQSQNEVCAERVNIFYQDKSLQQILFPEWSAPCSAASLLPLKVHLLDIIGGHISPRYFSAAHVSSSALRLFLFLSDSLPMDHHEHSDLSLSLPPFQHHLLALLSGCCGLLPAETPPKVPPHGDNSNTLASSTLHLEFWLPLPNGLALWSGI